MIEPALLQELRRGTLVLAVLSVLKQGEACGADVRATLAQALLPIEEGALYPMLRRLEDQSLLVSERRSEGSRLKRMYQLSKAGVAAHAAMSEQWRLLTKSLVKLNGDNE